MDEKFLVRTDEEYPSDERFEVRFVEEEMSTEYKQRLDALVAKLDKLVSGGSGADVLSEIKDILVELNVAIKNADNNKIYDALSRIEKSMDTENLQSAFDSKFYELNDNIQDIRDKINKRTDSEVKEMVLALSDKVDSVVAADDLKEMVSDLTIHVENLVQKYEEVNQKTAETRADGDVMDRHIVSELENINEKLNKGTGGELSDEVAKQLAAMKKSLTTAVTRANAGQQKVNRTVKDFNAYLVRLNSVDFMLRLLAAKSLLKKKRLPKWAKEKKSVLEKLVLGLEDEVADILIVSAIPKAGITMLELSRAIARTRKKTQYRVNQLMEGGFIEERTIKRKRLYFLVG